MGFTGAIDHSLLAGELSAILNAIKWAIKFISDESKVSKVFNSIVLLSSSAQALNGVLNLTANKYHTRLIIDIQLHLKTLERLFLLGVGFAYINPKRHGWHSKALDVFSSSQEKKEKKESKLKQTKP